MSCDNNSGGQAGSGSLQATLQNNIKLQQPPILASNLIPVAEDVGFDEAQLVDLTRGSYKIEATIEYSGQPVFITGEEKALNVGNELKRIYYDKIEIKNIRQQGDRSVADLIAVVTVIDNPVPIVPIIWGASIIGSGVAGWFFLDKAQEFTETTSGQLITLGAAALTIWAILKNNTK